MHVIWKRQQKQHRDKMWQRLKPSQLSLSSYCKQWPFAWNGIETTWPHKRNGEESKQNQIQAEFFSQARAKKKVCATREKEERDEIPEE